MKRCARCRTEKDQDEFPRAGKRGRHPYCRPCMNAYERVRKRVRQGLPPEGPTPSRAKPDGHTYVHKGYVREKRVGHHRADKDGYVPQHVLVMEAETGLKITREFTVHHRNADRADNRPANLELRVGPHGKGGDLLPTLQRVLEDAGAVVLWPGDKRNV